MRRSAWLRLAGAPLALALTAAARPDDLPDRSLRIAIAAALSVIERHSGSLWPASPGAPRQLLLVAGEKEFLFCPDPAVADLLAAEGFAPVGSDALSGCDVAVRARTVPPDLLATFPAVGGVSTVVVGVPAATGRSLPDWTATLLHEHVHQMQASAPGYAAGVAALDLAGGEQTGRWMLLDYPFPYERAAPGFRALADAALTALASDEARFADALDAYLAERGRFLASLSAGDARYVEFQLWQEGVARWSEAALAEASGLRWPLDEAWLQAHAARNRRELAGADLAGDGRAALYPLGAAEAALLERIGPAWRRRYLQEPFAMGPYFP